MPHDCLSEATIAWLISGDVSIQYQVRRDLLGEDPDGLESLQKRLVADGWGARFLSHQLPDGHWGRHSYQPTVCAIIEKTLTEMTGSDGGINFSPTFTRENRPTDVCVNGMFLNVAAYFR